MLVHVNCYIHADTRHTLLVTWKLKSKEENRKNSQTSFLPARVHLINRFPFLSKTTIDPEQFPRLKIRPLVFRRTQGAIPPGRTCVLGAALTGYDASKPSGNRIVK